MTKLKKGYGKHLLKPTTTHLFNAAGTISNITGFVNESELSVIEMKTLANLTHETLGLWNTATPDNPNVVAEGGTGLFRAVKMVQFGNYNKANRNDAGDLPNSEIKVKADIAGSEIAKYEIESLDNAGLAFGTRDAFLSSVASGVSVNLTALMDAHYLDLGVKTAALNKNTQEIINADFGDLDTTAKQTTAYRQVARAKIGLARKLTRYNIGSKESEYGTILHKFVTTDLLLAMPKGGDSATKIGRELAEGMVNIAGLGIVKDHVFLNQKIDKGTSMSKDTDFDFTNVFGMTAHKEALFIAIQALSSVITISPNSGNQIIITKFNFFKKAIRPDLLVVYRSVASV